MVWLPGFNLIAVVVMLAVATPRTFISVPVPMTVAPSLKSTVPVGSTPLTDGVTVAVRVTGPVLGSPNVLGFGASTVMVVVVARGVTVWVTLADVLAAKLVSLL